MKMQMISKYISEGTNFDKLFFNTDTVTAKKFYIQCLEKTAEGIKIPKKKSFGKNFASLCR